MWVVLVALLLGTPLAGQGGPFFTTLGRLGRGTVELPGAAVRHWRVSVPLLFGTAALVGSVDAAASGAIHSPGLERRSNLLSNRFQDFGEPLLALAAASDLGRCLRCSTLPRSLEITAASAVFASLSVAALKWGAGRERPYVPGDGDGGFNEGGNSFPSGHAIVAFAVASSLAHQFPRRRWVRWSAYSLAFAIAGLRFTAKEHFPSDLLMGGSLGYLIGR